MDKLKLQCHDDGDNVVDDDDDADDDDVVDDDDDDVDDDGDYDDTSRSKEGLEEGRRKRTTADGTYLIEAGCLTYWNY